MTWSMGHNKATDPTKGRYIPWTVVMRFREITTPIMLRGKEVTSYRAPVINEYLDRTTGEILSVNELRDSKELWPAFDFSERCLQREFILDSLRPEVREFALFVLRFRNKRRGVSPSFEQLARWFAEITGKRADNVRRYIKPLEKARIIAGESLLGPLFQIAGRSVPTSEHLAEDSNASAEFALLHLKERIKRTGIVIAKEPSWLQYVQPERIHSDLLCPELSAALKEFINRYVREHPEACFA